MYELQPWRFVIFIAFEGCDDNYLMLGLLTEDHTFGPLLCKLNILFHVFVFNYCVILLLLSMLLTVILDLFMEL